MNPLRRTFTLDLILLIILLLSVSSAAAKEHHISLLTVGDIDGEQVGGTADAYLTVEPGTGRIFLDSFPLTKIDTQISTRYANKIACDYLDIDCSRYDFFYTIRADSNIVGGPSASGALTVLTIAALEGDTLDNETVMTGTINSGGSIGPVGGISKKALAAQEAGFKRVLIPLFAIDTLPANATDTNENSSERNITGQTNGPSKENGGVAIGTIIIDETTNETINLSEKEPSLEELNLTIDVVKIQNLDEAIYYFTGKKAKAYDDTIHVPEFYTSTMKKVSGSLCARSELIDEEIVLAANLTLKNRTLEYNKNINMSLKEGNYYAASSYCFSKGLLLMKENLKQIQSIDPVRIKEIENLLNRSINEFNENLDNKKLNTLIDLETYVITKERLLEAEETLLQGNHSTDATAYALERYYSAVYWSEFFDTGGKEIRLDKGYLEETCYKKISEAEERINYAGIYAPFLLEDANTSIDNAYALSVKEDYKMCIFEASYAKAEANVILSSISVGEDRFGEMVDEKLASAKKLIAKEQSRGFFPLMGYSYYEYASALRENKDEFTAFIFSEYALEVGNLEMYFPKQGFHFPRLNWMMIILPCLALGIGFFLGGLYVVSKLPDTEKHKRKGLSRK